MKMHLKRNIRTLAIGTALALAMNGAAFAAANNESDAGGGQESACTDQQIEGGYEVNAFGECVLTGWNWVINGQCVSGSCKTRPCLTAMCDGRGGGGGGGGGGTPDPDPPSGDSGWSELMDPLDIYDQCIADKGSISSSTTYDIDDQGNISTFLEIDCVFPDGSGMNCISYIDPDDPDLLYQCLPTSASLPAPSDKYTFPDNRVVYEDPHDSGLSPRGILWQAPLRFDCQVVDDEPSILEGGDHVANDPAPARVAPNPKPSARPMLIPFGSFQLSR